MSRSSKIALCLVVGAILGIAGAAGRANATQTELISIPFLFSHYDARMYWRFENSYLSSIDVSKNIGIGYGNATTSAVAGKFGNGLLLDGTTDYVKIATTTGLPVANDIRAVSLWVNSQMADLTWVSLLNYGGEADGKGFDIYLTGTTAYFLSRGFGNLLIENVATGTWNNIIFTYDGATTIKGYLNGVYKSYLSLSSPLSTATTTDEVMIGCKNSTEDCLNGYIDDVAIFGKVLTDPMVANIYNYTANSITPIRPVSGGTYYQDEMVLVSSTWFEVDYYFNGMYDPAKGFYMRESHDKTSCSGSQGSLSATSTGNHTRYFSIATGGAVCFLTANGLGSYTTSQNFFDMYESSPFLGLAVSSSLATYTILATAPSSISLTYPTATTTIDFNNFIGNYNLLGTSTANIIIGINYSNGLDTFSNYLNTLELGSHSYSIQKDRQLNIGSWTAQAILYQNSVAIASSSQVNFSIGMPTGNYPTSTATSSVWTMTCDPTASWWQYSLCYLFYAVLVPNTAQQDEIQNFVSSTIKTAIMNKPPFGYFMALKTAWENTNIGATTTSTTIPYIAELDVIFNPFRALLIVVLWVFFGVWFVVRIKHFQL